ncbi:MAG: ECF transporter S component [Eubacteriales bacterium]
MVKSKQTQIQKIRQMVLLAVLTAIVMVLQLAGNYVRLPIMGTTVSLVLIPIALGAMLLGPAAGAWLGFVFGAVVYIQCGVMALDPFTAFLFNAHPIVTLLICVVKSTLAGFLAGLVYKLLKNKNEILAVFLAAAVTPIVNTGVFIIGCLAILSTIEGFMAAYEIGQSSLYFLFIGCAGINFIFEFILNMVMAPAIERIIHIFARRRH